MIPVSLDMSDAASSVTEMISVLGAGREKISALRDKALYTVACKAAIKAGRASDPIEWKPVVEAVLSGEVRYCPHGRPVTMSLGKSRLDKNFRRT